jgi:hypothetical protein
MDVPTRQPLVKQMNLSTQFTVNIEGYDIVLVRMDRNRHGCARCLLLAYIIRRSKLGNLLNQPMPTLLLNTYILSCNFIDIHK